MRLLVSLAAVALAQPALAQTPEPSPYDTASVALLPVEAAVDATQRTITGRLPVVVHRQDAHVTETARLGAAVSATFKRQAVEIPLALPAGAELFRVNIGRKSASVYCSPEIVSSETLPPTSRHGRVCLGDEDGDKVFERVGYMIIPTQWRRLSDGQSGVGLPPRIVGGAITWVAGQMTPAPYETPEQPGLPPVTLELVLEALPNAVFVELAQAAPGGEHADLGSQTVVWPRQLPHTLAIRGAEIRIESLVDGVLTYQLTHGLPTDRPTTFTSTFPPAPAPPPRAPKPQ